MVDPNQNDQDSLKRGFEDAKNEVDEVGGLSAFKSGEWFLNLIRKCFSNYYDRATADYFSAKYPGLGEEELLVKITKVAASNASIVGGMVGLAVSADEVSSFFTVPTSGGAFDPDSGSHSCNGHCSRVDRSHANAAKTGG